MSDVRERLRRASGSVTPPERLFERMTERRDRKRRNQRLASAAVALALTAGVVGGGLALLSGLGRDRAGPGSGRSNGRDLGLQPGQYFYLKIESSQGVDGWVRDEETWWAPDGSGEVRNHSTRQDKYPYPPTGSYGAGKFPIHTDVSKLSTDPGELAAQLRGKFGHRLAGPEPIPLWGATQGLLLDFPNTTPDLRAALYEVAAGLDGVTKISDARDPVGRTSVALEFTSERDKATWTMYFDDATHQLMASTYSHDGNPSVWVITESGIVDSAGSRPTGDQWLFPPKPPGEIPS